MRRLALLVLLSAALSALAAPAPLPRRERGAGPWVAGWDRPSDPVGGAQFVRQGKRLTITTPGAGASLHFRDGLPSGPHLLRSVVGDFSLTLRVSGELIPPHGGCRSVGIVLTAGD